MRKIKLIAFLTSILSALSLLSSGFSTWYYVNYPSTQDAAGSIQAYAVEDMNISITGMTVFSFSAIEFKGGNSNDTGEITVTYAVPEGAIEASSGKFTVNFELTYSDLSSYANNQNILFSNLNINSLTSNIPNNTVTVKCGDSIISNASIVNEDGFEKIKASYNFSIDAESTSHTFTVTYSFKISPDGGNFRNNFGKYINQKSTENEQFTKFIATATINPTQS